MSSSPSLGHELRSTLSPILNAVHLFGLPGATTKDLGYAMPVVERQVRHLARLVDDLLDVSRINTGKVELRPSPTSTSVRRRRVPWNVPSDSRGEEPYAHSRDARSPFLLADATRLEQVLGNLLNNAAKYTEPGGRIKLEVRREGDEGVVRVRDNGIGMDPEVLARVFDLFAQADRSLDRSQGASESASRWPADSSKCTAAAYKPRGEAETGSEFSVRLPWPRPLLDYLSCPRVNHAKLLSSGRAGPDRRRQHRRRSPPRPHPGRGRPPDDPGPRRSASAGDRSGAQPDAILLDIGLPGMDGYEVARRLRQTEGLQRVLLIAVTGYGQDRDRDRSIDAGFDYHLVKPVDVTSIRELIALHAGPSVEESPVIS